jgi:1-acyl-sn-glycerol-3-phosphate acyltransferase
MHWVYYFGRVLIRIVAFFFARWKVKGKENLPARGPVLIVCNHVHIADPPIVAASIKLRTVFMAKDDLWHNPWSRFWVENFGAFPVERGAFNRESIRRAEEWLQKGISVIIFPEGERSKTGKLKTAYSGAALIAIHTGVPILPVSIAGTDKLNHLRRCFFRRARITVTIGQPFSPPSPNGMLPKEQRALLTEEIMLEIAGLLPPEHRGVYGKEKTTHRESR